MSKNQKYLLGGAIVVVIIVVIIVVSMKGGTNPAATNGNPALSKFMNTPPDFSHSSASSTSEIGITANDRKAVYDALTNAYKTMGSGDAKAIRTLLLAKATSDAEKNWVNKMTDADIISLSARISATMTVPPANLLLQPTAVWARNGNVMTVSFSADATGSATSTVTMKAVYINGKWY